MAQVVVYGNRTSLDANRDALSRAIHGALVSALSYPEGKRFQRFVALEPGDFVYPDDRGPDYTIIEISLFEGRSDAARRDLITRLFSRIEAEAGIAPHSVEVTLTETPKVNWGIRGMNGADLALDYVVEV